MVDNSSKKKRVVVGVSGGVDSALSAALLKEQGYEVTGVFLECWKEPGCRTDEDRKDALEVALKLGIPFEVLDFRKEYKSKVVDYFYSEYRAGRTPNPDVMCNKEIKFGLFYDWALRRGAPQGKPFDYIATGHYARIKNGKLLRGVDSKKDQSYFLYRLRSGQLKHVLFPVGGMTKAQVRREARNRGLPVADKPDSQGICFIGPVNIQKFLRKKLPEKQGEVIDTRGEVIGEHDGVWFYTVGQRHGFRLNPKSLPGRQAGEIPSTKRTAIPPLYVTHKDVERNRLMVGFGAETYREQFRVKDTNWLTTIDNKQLTIDDKVEIRIRHGGKLISAEVKKVNGQWSDVKCSLREPQRGVAPGQSAVFYRNEVCIGGGIIQ